MSSKIRGGGLSCLLPEIKNGMEQNKPEYKELFCVFGVCSQAFSCLILATGRKQREIRRRGKPLCLSLLERRCTREREDSSTYEPGSLWRL